MPCQLFDVDVESVMLGGIAVNGRAGDDPVHLVFGVSFRKTLLALMMH